ncbi:hypothetical protein KKI24_10485 [bacterium]|nr:hypothetical protein [bacterium]
MQPWVKKTGLGMGPVEMAQSLALFRVKMAWKKNESWQWSGRIFSK